mmetsp:Transcript_12717/g.46956  ORF Transcript_12717/g.46956 Transcript_12717/m.46956 type:complete len:210 (-) Transcript_12717:1393-2022(-)
MHCSSRSYYQDACSAAEKEPMCRSHRKMFMYFSSMPGMLTPLTASSMSTSFLVGVQPPQYGYFSRKASSFSHAPRLGAAEAVRAGVPFIFGPVSSLLGAAAAAGAEVATGAAGACSAGFEAAFFSAAAGLSFCFPVPFCFCSWAGGTDGGIDPLAAATAAVKALGEICTLDFFGQPSHSLMPCRTKGRKVIPPMKGMSASGTRTPDPSW